MSGPGFSIAQAWNLASPFIAAISASWLTFFFGQRSKRSDLSSAERLAAFRALKPRLLALRRYAEARAANINGHDFEPRTDDLPEDISGSFLRYRDHLRFTVDEYRHILSDEALGALQPVRGSVDLACSMELVISYEDPHQSQGAADRFRQIASEAGAAVDRLWRALKMPT